MDLRGVLQCGERCTTFGVCGEEGGGGWEGGGVVGGEQREDVWGVAEGFVEDGGEFGEVGGDAGAGDGVEGGAG